MEGKIYNVKKAYKQLFSFSIATNCALISALLAAKTSKNSHEKLRYEESENTRVPSAGICRPTKVQLNVEQFSDEPHTFSMSFAFN